MLKPQSHLFGFLGVVVRLPGNAAEVQPVTVAKWEGRSSCRVPDVVPELEAVRADVADLAGRLSARASLKWEEG